MVKPAVDDVVLDTHSLSKKKVVRDYPAGRSNTGARQWLKAQLTVQYNAGPSRTHCSADTVGYRAAQQTHSCASAE